MIDFTLFSLGGWAATAVALTLSCWLWTERMSMDLRMRELARRVRHLEKLQGLSPIETWPNDEDL